MRMCFAAKLCRFKQEITLFRIFLKANENVSGIVFPLFLTSAMVACAIIRSGLKLMCTWKSPKGHSIASCKQWARSWPRCQLCASSQSHTGQEEPQQGPHWSWSNPCSTRAEPRNARTASVTGPAEHGQHTHSQDKSVQVWTPSYYPLKWQDTSQLLPKWTQTHQHDNIFKQCP